jgi:hypothetical protein
VKEGEAGASLTRTRFASTCGAWWRSTGECLALCTLCCADLCCAVLRRAALRCASLGYTMCMNRSRCFHPSDWGWASATPASLAHFALWGTGMCALRALRENAAHTLHRPITPGAATTRRGRCWCGLSAATPATGVRGR